MIPKGGVRDLGEADSSDLEAKLLVSGANIHWGNINNWKSSSLGGCDFDDGRVPGSTRVGTSIFEDHVLLSTFSGELNTVGSEDLKGLGIASSSTVLDGNGVLAVVSDLLSGFGSQKTKEGDLTFIVGALDLLSGVIFELLTTSHFGGVSVLSAGGGVGHLVDKTVRGLDTSPSLHRAGEVTEDFDSILFTTTVGIDPVHTRDRNFAGSGIREGEVTA